MRTSLQDSHEKETIFGNGMQQGQSVRGCVDSGELLRDASVQKLVATVECKVQSANLASSEIDELSCPRFSNKHCP